MFFGHIYRQHSIATGDAFFLSNKTTASADAMRGCLPADREKVFKVSLVSFRLRWQDKRNWFSFNKYYLHSVLNFLGLLFWYCFVCDLLSLVCFLLWENIQICFMKFLVSKTNIKGKLSRFYLYRTSIIEMLFFNIFDGRK